MGGRTIPKHMRYKSTESPPKVLDSVLILENQKIKYLANKIDNISKKEIENTTVKKTVIVSANADI